MENINSVSASSLKRAASKLRKYMIFSVGGERYAVPLSHVKEVIGLSKITPVPNKPSYFKGLVNLRGQIVAAFDLKARLKIVVFARSIKAWMRSIKPLKKMLPHQKNLRVAANR